MWASKAGEASGNPVVRATGFRFGHLRESGITDWDRNRNRFSYDRLKSLKGFFRGATFQKADKPSDAFIGTAFTRLLATVPMSAAMLRRLGGIARLRLISEICQDLFFPACNTRAIEPLIMPIPPIAPNDNA